MKLLSAAVLVTVLVLVAAASGANTDQGRRLAGPFCVGKTFLKPLDGSRATNVPTFRISILRAGVVRSVALNQKCRPWENRKVRARDPRPRQGHPRPRRPRRVTPGRPDLQVLRGPRRSADHRPQGRHGRDRRSGDPGRQGRHRSQGRYRRGRREGRQG